MRKLEQANGTDVVQIGLINDNFKTQEILEIYFAQPNARTSTFFIGVHKNDLQAGQKVLAMRYTLDDCPCHFIGQIGVVESTGNAGGQDYVYVKFDILDRHRSCHFAFAPKDLEVIE